MKTEFEIIGTLPPMDGKPERKVAVADGGTRFAVLHQAAGAWQVKAGPWSYETWVNCAERVCAGDARAITWSDAQICLAAGVLVFIVLAERAAKNTTKNSEGAAGSATAEEPPPQVLVPPPAAADFSHEPPRDPRCDIAGCGE